MTGSQPSKSVLSLLLVTSVTCGIAVAGSQPFISFRRSVRLQQSPSEKLNASVDRLTRLTDPVSRLRLAGDATPEQTERVVASIENIIRMLDFIRRDIGAKKLVLGDEAVGQLAGFAALMVSILTDLNQSDPRLTAAQQKTIEAVEADLNLRMSRIGEIRGSSGPVSYPGVRVVVRTLKSDGTQEANLRVYYLGEVYFDSELAKDNLKTFDRLSSPSDREIPEGYYRVWAGRGNDPTPVSDVKSLQAIKPSNGAEITVDLLILK